MNKVRVIGTIALTLFFAVMVFIVAQICTYLAAPKVLNQAAVDLANSAPAISFIDDNTFIDTSGTVTDLYVRPAFWSVDLTPSALLQGLAIVIVICLVLIVLIALVGIILGLGSRKTMPRESQEIDDAEEYPSRDRCGNGACQCTGHNAEWFNPDLKRWEYICRNPYCKCDDHCDDAFSFSRNMWVYENEVEPGDVFDITKPIQSTT